MKNSPLTVNLVLRASGLLLLILGVGLYCYWIRELTLEFPRSDSYRHIVNFLMPNLSGNGIDLSAFWNNPHPKPVYGLLLYVNALWFGLDFRLEAGLYFAAGLLLLGLFARLMASSRPAPGISAAGFITLVLLFFNVGDGAHITWSLVTQIYFILLLVFVYYQLFISFTDRPRASMEAGFAAYQFVFFLISFDEALLATAPLILYLLVRMFAARTERPMSARILVYTSVSAICSSLVISSMNSYAGTDNLTSRGLDNLLYFLGAPGDGFRFVAFSLAEPLVNHAYLARKLGLEQTWAIGAYAVSVCYVIIYLAALRTAFRDATRVGRMCALIMTFHLAFIASVMLFRFEPESQTVYFSLSPRYHLIHLFGWIAAATYFFTWCPALAGSFRRDRLILAGRTLMLLVVGTASVTYAIEFSGKSRFIQSNSNATGISLLRVASGIDVRPVASWHCLNEAQCKQALDVLRVHQLNLFSMRYNSRFSRACDAEVVNAEAFFRSNFIRLELSREDAYVDVTMNGQLVSLKSFGTEKLIRAPLKDMNEVKITLHCFRNYSRQSIGDLQISRSSGN